MRQQQSKKANHQSGYLELFFKAQVLLERMSSSHFQYKELVEALSDTSLSPRIQRVMVGLSKRILRQTRFRRIENYSIEDKVEQELESLKVSTSLLAERQVFTGQVQNQLNYLLDNLTKVCELTQTHTPFPHANFLFSEESQLGWKRYRQLCFTTNTPIFRHAARLTICMVAGYGLMQFLPPDSQNFWWLLTTLIITKPTFSETKQRLVQRVTGTFVGIGVATGLYMMSLPVIPLVFIAVAAKFLFFWYFQQRYAIAVGCISVYVAILLQFYGLDAEALFVKRVPYYCNGSSACFFRCKVSLARLVTKANQNTCCRKLEKNQYISAGYFFPIHGRAS